MVCFANWVKQDKRQISHLGPAAKHPSYKVSVNKRYEGSGPISFRVWFVGFFLSRNSKHL